MYNSLLSSDEIYWDVEQLKDMKSALDKKHQEVVELRNEFVNQKNLLSSVWQGMAGELQIYRLEQTKCKFESIICRIESEIAILNTAISRYEECEKQVLAKVRNRVAYSSQISFSGDGEGSFGGGGGGFR